MRIAIMTGKEKLRVNGSAETTCTQKQHSCQNTYVPGSM